MRKTNIVTMCKKWFTIIFLAIRRKSLVKTYIDRRYIALHNLKNFLYNQKNYQHISNIKNTD